ncbi:MAG: class II aldolase/adducin family protein [Elusimicrobia bacterium]|nr:class II aldolase/adducin family protein [Elusimicrobiota bacterium]
MKKNEQGHRKDLVECGQILGRLGYCPATSGNFSVRLDPWLLLITPTGISKEGMQPEDIVLISPEGQRRFGRRNPSSEKNLHLQIYRLRSDVNAVVHAHPPLATAFACAGISLDQPIASEFIMAVGKAPLAKYGTPGSPDLATAMENLIPHHTAILMGNHGVVTYGKDLCEARQKMELVEHFAQIVLGTFKLGRQVALSPEDLQKLEEAAKRYNTDAKD